MTLPARHYTPSPRSYQPHPALPQYDDNMAVRKADATGRSSFKGYTLKAGKAFIREHPGTSGNIWEHLGIREEAEDGVYSAWWYSSKDRLTGNTVALPQAGEGIAIGGASRRSLMAARAPRSRKNPRGYAARKILAACAKIICAGCEKSSPNITPAPSGNKMVWIVTKYFTAMGAGRRTAGMTTCAVDNVTQFGIRSWWRPA
jgi:hypothetical protein